LPKGKRDHKKTEEEKGKEGHRVIFLLIEAVSSGYTEADYRVGTQIPTKEAKITPSHTRGLGRKEEKEMKGAELKRSRFKSQMSERHRKHSRTMVFDHFRGRTMYHQKRGKKRSVRGVCTLGLGGQQNPRNLS